VRRHVPAQRHQHVRRGLGQRRGSACLADDYVFALVARLPLRAQRRVHERAVVFEREALEVVHGVAHDLGHVLPGGVGAGDVVRLDAEAELEEHPCRGARSARSRMAGEDEGSLAKSASRRSRSRITASSMSSSLNSRCGHAVREAEEGRDDARGDLGEALGPDG
jgi:hypothetical protein